MVDLNESYSPLGSSSPKGLSIQFSMPSPTMPAPQDRRSSLSTFTGDIDTRRLSAGDKRSGISSSSSLLSELKQVQRELSLLARTENLRISRGTQNRVSSGLSSGDHSNRNSFYDDGDISETFVDSDSNNADADKEEDLFVMQMSEEMTAQGRDFDIRNAVIQRLAEIRDKRSHQSQELSVGSALRQLFRDILNLGKAIAASCGSAIFPVESFILAAVIVLLAWAYFRMT